MKKRLVVISADAMVDQDLEFLATQPNFSQIAKKACMVDHVRTIYPTITYPAHTSMCSGAYPNKHGIIGNDELTVGSQESMPWNWFHKAVKVKDIFDMAHEAGYKTAAVFWPVTGCHPSIDYLIDEYWPQFDGDDLAEAFRRAGSSDDVVEKIIKPNIQGCKMRLHPESEEMGTRFVCAMIREYKPEVLFYHPANIDHFRHASGLFNEDVTQALRDTDRWLGDIIRATKDAGVYEDTNFVLMSDHGQMNVNRIMHLNVVLADNGFIRLDKDGNITSWDAITHSGGMITYCYLRPDADWALREKVYALLKHLESEGIYGIGKVFTRDEINEKEHLSGKFDFAIETDGYTSFGQRVTRPMITPYGDPVNHDYRLGHATHGYLPDKGPQPVFIAWGKDFNEGVHITRRPIVDMPCTMAKLLGVELLDADGKAIDEFLK